MKPRIQCFFAATEVARAALAGGDDPWLQIGGLKSVVLVVWNGVRKFFFDDLGGLMVDFLLIL